MTRDLKPGDTAPEFRLESTAGDVTLDGVLTGGRRLILAFYFEDGAPSCETEIAMLRDTWEVIEPCGGAALAVSRLSSSV